MRGREGRREGGEREGERELCDLVIRESILGEQEIEAANEKRKGKENNRRARGGDHTSFQKGPSLPAHVQT